MNGIGGVLVFRARGSSKVTFHRQMISLFLATLPSVQISKRAVNSLTFWPRSFHIFTFVTLSKGNSRGLWILRNGLVSSLTSCAGAGGTLLAGAAT